MSLNTVSIADLTSQLRISFLTNATTCIVGQPGAGKTQVARRAAIDFLRTQYKVSADHYYYWLAPTKSSEFVGGIMMPDGGECDLKVPAWIFRIKPNSVCHLDEIDKLPLRDQMAWLQLLHEGAIDGKPLPKNVHWVLTANRLVDRGGSAGVNVLLNNRCRVFDFMPRTEEVLRYMQQSKFHFMVQAFLQENPGSLNDYVSSRDRNPTSRSWEAVSHALYALGEGATPREIVLTVAGSVPDDVAQKFQLFGELKDSLIPVSSVMLDPAKAKVPAAKDRGLQLLQLTMVAAHAAGMKTAEKYSPDGGKTQMTRAECKAATYKYAQRFPAEYLMAVMPTILSNAADADDPNGQSIPPCLTAGETVEIVKNLRSRQEILKG